jgi:hypothetical protein
MKAISITCTLVLDHAEIRRCQCTLATVRSVAAPWPDQPFLRQVSKADLLPEDLGVEPLETGHVCLHRPGIRVELLRQALHPTRRFQLDEHRPQAMVITPKREHVAHHLLALVEHRELICDEEHVLERGRRRARRAQYPESAVVLVRTAYEERLKRLLGCWPPLIDDDAPPLEFEIKIRSQLGCAISTAPTLGSVRK